MDENLMLYLGRLGLEKALLLSAPVLLVTLGVGFFTALIQAVTSIRDQSLGMVLKLAAVGVTLLVCGGWMMQVSVEFTRQVFNHIQTIGHG